MMSDRKNEIKKKSRELTETIERDFIRQGEAFHKRRKNQRMNGDFMPFGNRTFRFYVDSSRLSEMFNGHDLFSMMLHAPTLSKNGKEVRNDYVRKHEFVVDPETNEKNRSLRLVDVRFKVVKE